MAPDEFSPHIRFVDIARNPNLLDLYGCMRHLLPDAQWWITDENGHRIPFLEEDASAYCLESSGSDNQYEDLCGAGLDIIQKNLRASDGCVLTKCNDFHQGLAGCWYRNHFLGGIGICHVPFNQQKLLDQTLRIIHGYLSLLSGAIEDHDDLELVHYVWSQTITKIKLEDLLPRLMDEICTAVGLKGGIIFLFNEDGEFFPACLKHYPLELLKRKNLEVTRYEYRDCLQSDELITFDLSEDDPLRKWLVSELPKVNYAFSEDDGSFLAVPFFRNHTLVGIFVSTIESLRPLSVTKLSLIRLLATSGGAAIDNSQTVQRMDKRRKALATIHVIHRLICSCISSKDLLPRIGQLTCQLLKATKCSIMLIDPETQRLMPDVRIGLEENEVGQVSLDFGEGLPGWVAENLNPVFYHPKGDSKPPWVSVGETYPADSYLAVALFDTDVEGVIVVSGKDDDFNPGDREILLTFAEQAIIAIKNARLHEGERTITINALRSIANLIETQDPEREGVAAKTCECAQRIARVMNLSSIEYQCITYASLLHDIGMVVSNGNVSSDELRMKKPKIGLHFVKSLGLQKEVGQIVFHSNEAWNGQGYPEGLKGVEIPLGSRIIAVANAYASLVHRWGGEKGDNPLKALDVIWRLSERSFDPDVISALQQTIQQQTKKDA